MLPNLLTKLSLFKHPLLLNRSMDSDDSDFVTTVTKAANSSFQASYQENDPFSEGAADSFREVQESVLPKTTRRTAIITETSDPVPQLQSLITINKVNTPLAKKVMKTSHIDEDEMWILIHEIVDGAKAVVRDTEIKKFQDSMTDLIRTIASMENEVKTGARDIKVAAEFFKGERKQHTIKELVIDSQPSTMKLVTSNLIDWIQFLGANAEGKWRSISLIKEFKKAPGLFYNMIKESNVQTEQDSLKLTLSLLTQAKELSKK